MQYSLKELRARKDVTQAEAAKALGVSTQTYNAWEKDVSVVSIAKFCQIAKYFGVSITEIFLPNN